MLARAHTHARAHTRTHAHTHTHTHTLDADACLDTLITHVVSLLYCMLQATSQPLSGASSTTRSPATRRQSATGHAPPRPPPPQLQGSSNARRGSSATTSSPRLPPPPPPPPPPSTAVEQQYDLTADLDLATQQQLPPTNAALSHNGTENSYAGFETVDCLPPPPEPPSDELVEYDFDNEGAEAEEGTSDHYFGADGDENGGDGGGGEGEGNAEGEGNPEGDESGDGDAVPKQCGECSVTTAAGRIDPANGTWYCTDCWESFESY